MDDDELLLLHVSIWVGGFIGVEVIRVFKGGKGATSELEINPHTKMNPQNSQHQPGGINFFFSLHQFSNRFN